MYNENPPWIVLILSPKKHSGLLLEKSHYDRQNGADEVDQERHLPSNHSIFDGCNLPSSPDEILRMTKSALIAEITGSGWLLLAELLLNQGYRVHGLVRRSSSFSTGRIDHLYRDIHETPQLRLHYGDLTDGQTFTNVVQDIEPNEIDNLGAQSGVRISFDPSVYILMTDGVGALNVPAAARLRNKRKECRVYQASSTEMYGRNSR